MAELLAAGAALGVASSIITFADVGWRILKRVKEFTDAVEDVPEVLKDIKALLPLLIEKMDQLKVLGEERLQQIEPQSALVGAITGCRSHIDRLEVLVNKLLPLATDSRFTKTQKAAQSVFYEAEISKILVKLENYKSSFIFHFTDISTALDRVTRIDESYYVVPSLQVSEYVERIELLSSIKTAVQQMREQQRRQVVVLLGMGGQGKSQLAMEYCRTARLSKEFRAVFWIDASSIKSVHRSFESITTKMADPSRTFDNLEEKIAFVKDTLERWESRWLLVFDNYDDPSTDFNVAVFFPSSPFGTIIVTGRHEDSERLGKVLRLDKMTEQESLELLLRRSKYEPTEGNVMYGKSVVEKLGLLPLAIDQAGAFISSQKLPLKLFLEQFDLQKEGILKYTPALSEYRRKLGDNESETALNVFTTWELSFQQIGRDEAGERLRLFLTTAAFFSVRGIGEDLFYNAGSLNTTPSWIDAFVTEGEWDSARYRRAVVELSKLSLLSLAVDDIGYCRFYLHPLIADWLRLRADQEERRLCTIESCYLLAKLVKSMDLKATGYAVRLYLLEHLDECLNNKRTYLKPVDEDVGFAKTCITQFADLLKETSRYREGISLLEEALPVVEGAYGIDDTTTFNWYHSLGDLYSDQGKFVEAEEIYKRALVGYEKALGKDHLSTLNIVNNLGLLYSDKGKLVEAEEMYERALAGKEKALGKDHTSTLNTVHNLGLLYYNQGKLVEAEEMYESALAGWDRALGKDHKSTLDTVNNLGILYYNQGKLVEAEEMYECALAGMEKALGKDHMSTLDIVHNLGLLYSKQGKLVEAEEMHKRALAGREKAPGKDHKSTLDAVYNMATLMEKQGDLVRASQMFERAFLGYRNILGADNPETIDAREELERVSHLQQKKASTKKGFWEKLRRRSKIKGGMSSS
jgi:tetratricopeptide (TPR) repeat protein